MSLVIFVRWHIATDICYYTRENIDRVPKTDSETTTRDWSKFISETSKAAHHDVINGGNWANQVP